MPATWTKEQLVSGLVRYADLIPCVTAFIDTRTPGSDRKENFTIIGPGVAENPAQFVHISDPHGFNIGGARQPPGCVNSQHSHETEEVFLVNSGRWRFLTGEHAEGPSIDLEPGDVISLPTNVFRGFENVGEQAGFLFAVLGGDNPGRVTWAPHVIREASDHGLILLENGSLIDTRGGEEIPAGARPVQPLGAAEAAAFRQLSPEELACAVIRYPCSQPEKAVGGLSNDSGVVELPLIGAENRRERMPAGAIGYDHGFHLRLLMLSPGAAVNMHSRQEREVLLTHQGPVHVRTPAGGVVLGSGDTLSIPVGMPRSFCNPEAQSAAVFIVRAGNSPSAAVWHAD